MDDLQTRDDLVADGDLGDGFRELSFDEAADGEADDPFMAEFRGLPDADDASGARQNVFLRVAYGRKLLDYDQERELGRRLREGRLAMTEALSSFAPCIGHLIGEWDRAILGDRSPGEVLQWPSGAPSQGDGDDGSRKKGGPSARQRMATLSMLHSCWRMQDGAGAERVAPLDQRAAFADAVPAFSMLCELDQVARSALQEAPARFRGRADLERALERAAAARMRFQEARRVMLESNLRLVFSIAGKFVNNGIAYDDLVQEGSIGLLRAIEKFEPSLGFKFSTYASTWIWQAVTRAIANQRRTVRVPAHIHDKMIRVRSTAARIYQDTGREPGVAELAEACDLTPEVVGRALNAANRSMSLDAPIRAGEDTSFLDLTPDREQPEAAVTVQGEQVSAIVRDALGCLPKREQQILSLRLGMDGTEPLTLEEIGAILGITRERTRQLQNRALDAVRSRLNEVGSALI
jgi:RNA polymerase primary sigma factor